MSFRVTPNPTFAARVTVMVPSDTGPEKQDLSARFAFRDDDEIPAITGANGGIDFLRAVIVDLSDLVDEAGQPVTYTPGLRDQLLKLPFFRNALIKAYFAGINGAALGN